MTARKISEAEKQDILHLYRTTTETSSSLAARFGVSTSTVSRLLKNSLPADEYEVLIQQKRSLRSSDATVDAEVLDAGASVVGAVPTPAIASSDDLDSAEVSTSASSDQSASERARPILRRSRQTPSAEIPSVTQLEVPLESTEDPPSRAAVPSSKPTRSAESTLAEAEVLKEILSQNVIEPEEEDDASSDLDDELDDLEDDEEDDFEDEGDDTPIFGHGLKRGFMVQILPFADATLPRTCYLVVDRSAELVAPPLKEFGDLGQIPDEEVHAKTLPIFDNHRIAKRYSNPRTQRVIKLPDGRMLSKTSSHLRAKGITRLLIDGQVYSIV